MGKTFEESPNFPRSRAVLFSLTFRRSSVSKLGIKIFCFFVKTLFKKSNFSARAFNARGLSLNMFGGDPRRNAQSKRDRHAFHLEDEIKVPQTTQIFFARAFGARKIPAIDFGGKGEKWSSVRGSIILAHFRFQSTISTREVNYAKNCNSALKCYVQSKFSRLHFGGVESTILLGNTLKNPYFSGSRLQRSHFGMISFLSRHATKIFIRGT